jgi:hypothetical protein
LDGVTFAEVSAAPFQAAIFKSIEEVIGFNDTSITMLVVSEGTSGRKMLSMLSVTYSISLISRLTSQEVLRQLQAAIDSGVFLTSLRINSGYALGKPTATSLTLAAPSLEPTLAPTGAPQVSTGKKRQSIRLLPFAHLYVRACVRACALKAHMRVSSFSPR